MATHYIAFMADVNDQTTARLRVALTDASNAGADEIQLFISSGGGSVSDGLSIAALIKALPGRVVTHNIGQTDSVANVIFAAGDQRYASSNASFLFHGVAMPVVANTTLSESQLLETYNNVVRLRQSIANNFASYSGVALTRVEALMNAAGGQILTAAQALTEGIIHDIREPSIPVGAQVVSIGNL